MLQDSKTKQRLLQVSLKREDLAAATESNLLAGGSSGIGQAFVQLISSLGGRAINGDLKDPGESVPGVTFVRTDVSSWTSLLHLFKVAKEELERIDIVFVNAGNDATKHRQEIFKAKC